MSDYSFGKTEIIIIIIISLLVAFIIGFNIIQVIDNKLNSVTINVPPQNCVLPPIYLNLDKNNNIQQIKLNDLIIPTTNENDKENFQNISDNINNDNNNINNLNENFGNLEEKPDYQEDQNIIAGLVNSNLGNEIIDQQSYFETAKDPYYNTVNNLPLLFSPDPPSPNQAAPDTQAYYQDRPKLVTNKNSPLLLLEQKNLDILNNTIEKCELIKANTIPNINGPYDGYNSFINLGTDSYANVTSIGKSMLTPYVSFPIPS